MIFPIPDEGIDPYKITLTGEICDNVDPAGLTRSRPCVFPDESSQAVKAVTELVQDDLSVGNLLPEMCDKVGGKKRIDYLVPGADPVGDEMPEEREPVGIAIIGKERDFVERTRQEDRFPGRDQGFVWQIHGFLLRPVQGFRAMTCPGIYSGSIYPGACRPGPAPGHGMIGKILGTGFSPHKNTLY